jgi:hypothetical protein
VRRTIVIVIGLIVAVLICGTAYFYVAGRYVAGRPGASGMSDVVSPVGSPAPPHAPPGSGGPDDTGGKPNGG